MAEIIRAIEPINIELAILASRNRAPEMLAKWADFLERDRDHMRRGEFPDFQRSQVEFVKLMAAASENQVLELFVLTLYDFCGAARPEQDLMIDHPERVSDYWERRTELVEAIIEGDTEIASVRARRCARMVSDWLTEGTASRPSGKQGSDHGWEYLAFNS